MKLKTYASVEFNLQECEQLIEEYKNKQRKDMEEEEEESKEYEIESIIDMKIEKGKELYCVKWKGFATSESTWEPSKQYTS
jgi:hypothetical protein